MAEHDHYPSTKQITPKAINPDGKSHWGRHEALLWSCEVAS